MSLPNLIHDKIYLWFRKRKRNVSSVLFACMFFFLFNPISELDAHPVFTQKLSNISLVFGLTNTVIIVFVQNAKRFSFALRASLILMKDAKGSRASGLLVPLGRVCVPL